MNTKPEDSDSSPDFEDTDFPPPHSAVWALNDLARKHGLIQAGEYISEEMRDFLADVIEQCARTADAARGSQTPGQYVRTWMAPESLEEARELERKYELDYAAEMERLDRDRGRS